MIESREPREKRRRKVLHATIFAVALYSDWFQTYLCVQHVNFGLPSTKVARLGCLLHQNHGTSLERSDPIIEPVDRLRIGEINIINIR